MMRTVLVITVLAKAYGLRQPICDNNTSIDISKGTHLQNGDIYFKGELYSKEDYYTDVQTGSQRACICSKVKCVRKCCKLGYGYDYNKKTCEPINHVFNPPVWDNYSVIDGANASTMFHFVYGKINCTHPRVRIRIKQVATNIRLQKNGQLFVQSPDRLENTDNYCIDTFYYGNESGHLDALLCYEEEAIPTNPELDLVRQICMVISCMFFLATLGVYAWLPELRNLHGKVLMAYLTCMLFGFIFLGIVQIIDMKSDACAILTLVTCFWLHSAFFWLNVMSFDIWWTFSGKRGLSLERLSTRERFHAYCLYAFGVPFLLVAVTASLEYANLPYSPFLPMLRTMGCFLYRIHKFFYLYLPMLIICVANTVFFILTAVKIARIKQQTSVLNSKDSSTTDTHSKDTQRLILYVKLFAVMGINWILEVVSSFFPNLQDAFIITDVYNVLTGVIIFIIFVCKRKIIRLMKKRIKDGFHQKKPEPGDLRHFSRKDTTKWEIFAHNQRGSLDTIRTSICVDSDTSSVKHGHSATDVNTIKHINPATADLVSVKSDSHTTSV